MRWTVVRSQLPIFSATLNYYLSDFNFEIFFFFFFLFLLLSFVLFGIYNIYYISSDRFYRWSSPSFFCLEKQYPLFCSLLFQIHVLLIMKKYIVLINLPINSDQRKKERKKGRFFSTNIFFPLLKMCFCFFNQFIIDD